MSYIHLVPEWFFGFDIAMEFLFAFTAALVALYSFYIYHISQQRESRLFGSGFLLISISYLIKVALNMFVLTEIKSGLLGISLEHLSTVGRVAAYANLLLFMIGLITLVYLTFRAKGIRLYALLVALALVPLIFSTDRINLFIIISSMLLALLCIHYLREYDRTKNKRTLSVLIAFTLLLLSNIWTFIAAENYYLTFVIGLFMELAAYLLIMMSLFLTIRRTSHA